MSTREAPPEDSRIDGLHTGSLKDRYFDYCSARIADVLLRLSADEVFLLAEAAARESGAALPTNYPEIVALATARVSRQLEIPSFEVWSVAYLEDPHRFDPFLLGLWKESGTEG